jgi:hypothetical protein
MLRCTIEEAKGEPMSSELELTRRTSIDRKALEAAIVADVQTSDPSCEGFVGVMLERAAADSSADANWKIKGIRFGRAERDKCNVALISVVERMQRQYEVSDFRSMTSRTS